MSYEPDPRAVDAPTAPTFNFRSAPSAVAFTVPLKTYVTSNPQFDAIAVGAVVFNSSGKMLLIQRAAHDSFPSRWETPGGACDLDDESILHGLARELWEESGLILKGVGPMIKCGKEDGAVFFSRRGLRICKFTFEVEVEEGEVKLDPNEHQSYLWVTEEECLAKRVGEMELQFSTKQQEVTIWEAWKAKRERDGKTE